MDGNAIVIETDGRVGAVALPDHDRLKTMYAVLHCHNVDVVSLTSKIDMWLDDEGMYNHPVNPYATELARRYGLTHQPYFGPALLCGVTRDGDTINLTHDQAKAALTLIIDVLVSLGAHP
ncbi:DUF3846 domain-containing protein [Actinopolymorpha pittospori]|uniref:DUF3846 domain-containing protein n=1 Tax=Actinopolymorpha pittospori TaxID=648752 RepID=A0A927MXE7_9ACTN|nr:DUF3846 domain-containing protein [Actinopolymorpha pittospori]MBE1608691.1 hypothetical protein [Actinopolymorpha pittospori]